MFTKSLWEMENLQKKLKKQKEYTIQLNKESDKLNQRIEDLKKQLEVKNEVIKELFQMITKVMFRQYQT